MLDTDYLSSLSELFRTCVWCYRDLGPRRVGRYCCVTCHDDAQGANRCEYCGEPAQARDHVVPRAYRRAMDGTWALAAVMARVPDTVPTCHECNSLAGSDVFDSLEEKRRYIQQRLEVRNRRLMCMPAWENWEIDELTGRMKQAVGIDEAKRRVLMTRLSWPGNAR